MAENHPAVYFDGRDIVIDGRKTQILSGAVHYFRSMPGRWDAICRRARAMGLNTIETYIPWYHYKQINGRFQAFGKTFTSFNGCFFGFLVNNCIICQSNEATFIFFTYD